uniref:Uncharacterized protein n=1 Tax=Anguilla anguilla TaxID=7936 RepID=A0A0E9VT68_ANGAN
MAAVTVIDLVDFLNLCSHLIRTVHS